MTIWIPGVPKSTQTGSIVRVGNRAFPKRRGTEWSAYVKLVMQQHRPSELLSGPLFVSLVFCMPKLASGHRAYPTKRPDVDNLLKGFLDCGNGVLWGDDSQIVSLDVSKTYSDTPGVRVIARNIEQEEV